MKRLSLFTASAVLPFYAMAGDGGVPIPVDEPSVLALLVLAGAVVGALKLKAKFKK